MIGGGLLSGVGGIMGGVAANREGRKARDYSAKRTAEGMNRLGYAFFGADPFNEYMRATTLYGQGDGSVAPYLNANANANLFGNASPGSIFGQMQGISGSAGAGRNAALGRFDRDSASLFGTGLYNAQAVGGLYDRARNDTIGRFRSDMGRVAGVARGYGAGAEALIDEDAGRALTEANRISTARMAGSGLGNSTLLSNQMAGNTATIRRAAARDKVGVQRERADREMGALSAMASGTLGAGTSLYGQQAGALERGLGSTLDRAASRSALRTGIEQDNIGRDEANRRNDLLMALNVLQGPVMNPWLGAGTSQYYPGVSPGGSALTSVGNSLAMLGAYGMARNENSQGGSRGGLYGPPYPGLY